LKGQIPVYPDGYTGIIRTLNQMYSKYTSECGWNKQKIRLRCIVKTGKLGRTGTNREG